LIFDQNVKKYEIEKDYFVSYKIPPRNQKEFDILCGSLEYVLLEKRTAIITTTLNCERTILDTLKSVEKQSIDLNKIVHILIDLGSSDKTKDICRSFEKEHAWVKFVSFGELTPAQAFNYFIYNYLPCNFPYVDFVVFLDQGDLFVSKTIETILKSFECKDYKDVGAFYSGFGIVDEKNRIVDRDFKKAVMMKNQLSADAQDKLRDLFIVDNPCRYVKSFRLECIYDVGGFKQRYALSSEFHMFGKILSKYKVAKIDSILYMLKKPISFKPNYEKAMEMKKIKKEFFNLWDQRKRDR